MSRDIKSTDITGINDGLDRAINRLRRQMRAEMTESMKIASENTEKKIAELKLGYYQTDQEELSRRIEELQSELGAQIDEQARFVNQSLLENEAKYTETLQRMSDTLHDSMIEEQERFTKQMQTMLDEQNRAFEESLDDVYTAMEEQQGQIEALTENLANFQADVDRQFAAQQSQIDTLQQGVKTLFALREDEKNKKLLAAGRALALLEEVRKRTPVDRFASKDKIDKVALLEKRLKGIKSNPDSCTITDVNALVDETIIMEREALREQAKWQAKQNLAMTTVNALLRMMQASMQLKVNSLYDETQQEELQTDYWTHGRYHELEDQVNKAKVRIDSKKADFVELDGLIGELKKMEKGLDRLREEAVQLGLLCEGRVKMTNDILNAMVEQGWEVKEENVGFMGSEEDAEDWREGSFAILRDSGSDMEISIIIYPEKQQDGEVINKIVFHRNDDTIESEGEFQMHLEHIKEQIETSGLHLGELSAPPCGGDGKIDQARSSAELKRRGAAQKLKEELRQQR